MPRHSAKNSRFKTIKDYIFIILNLAVALNSTYWTSKLINLNAGTDPNYFISTLIIGGILGSFFIFSVRSLLKKRRSYNFYYMTFALLATAVFCGTLSFISSVFLLTSV